MSKPGPTCCPSDLLRSSNHSDAQLVDVVDGTVAHAHGCAGALPPAETPQPHNTWAAELKRTCVRLVLLVQNLQQTKRPTETPFVPRRSEPDPCQAFGPPLRNVK
jgi:hypothetical protein